MRPHVIDTNLYIEAVRDPAALDALATFYRRSVSRIYLHSVVAQELLAGTTTVALERRTRTHFIEPFEAVGRVITPTHRAWKRAGEILAILVRRKLVSPGGFSRGFVNDCVLAASAREVGFVLVTQNTRDFELIRKVESMEISAPWPSPE